MPGGADKAAATWRSRGIRFEDAATVFMDPLFVLVDASRKDEARDAVILLDKRGRPAGMFAVRGAYRI